jgi:hypothetical protein
MKYVVQRESMSVDANGKPSLPNAWQDIATIEAESRTKRSTVIKKALAEANIAPSERKLRLRVLDAESAKVYEPEAHQPPAEWRLR